MTGLQVAVLDRFHCTAIQWIQFTCVLPVPPLCPVCMCMDVHASSVCTSLQVGAAISMTYITGQPIVFVGTGQTYSDLKNLNVQSVVQALLS